MKITKILSCFMISAFLMTYIAPVGLCANEVQLRADKVEMKDALPTVLKLEGEISITKGNPKISLSLRDSDVKQVLRMFADKAGLNIVFHNSVDGKVTLDLVNMPLNDAFKLVMQISDLTYYIDKNTMVVAAASASQSLNLSKQEMVAIPVKYVEASVLAEFMNKNIFSINKPGLSNSQIAITNPAANEILIFGTDNDVKMAKKIIDKFDVKPSSASFAVNHTTPKEMATLLCTVLFPPSTATGGGAGSAPQPQPAAGKPTGGAAAAGGSVSGLSLGENIIACEYDNKISAGNISSFNSKSMIISYFPQRGTISVKGGSQRQLEMIKEFIEQNDVRQPQAYLEISIIELNESGMRDFSNTWQYLSKNFSANFDGTTKSNPYYPMFFRNDEYTVIDPLKPDEPVQKILQYAGAPSLVYSINYLIQNQKGRVLANPRIMITNGQNSTIDLTADYVKTVKSEVLAQGGGMAGAVQRTYEIGSDEGIKVDMIPFISPEGYVTLNIKPEYSTVKEKIYTPNEDDPTVKDLAVTLLQRRNLDLKNIRIKDGETLVIAGMIREDEQKSVSKIPVLGDLPGVGFFFRNTSTTKSKQELVIMITPKIIKDTEELVQNEGTAL